MEDCLNLILNRLTKSFLSRSKKSEKLELSYQVKI